MTARPDHYLSYSDFLAADARRRVDALEFGHHWQAADGTYRICWYERTGELTAERLSEIEPLELEDFHHGVSGPVHILAHIPTRAQLDRLIGTWPNIALEPPHTLQRLRERIAQAHHIEPVHRG